MSYQMSICELAPDITGSWRPKPGGLNKTLPLTAHEYQLLTRGYDPRKADNAKRRQRQKEWRSDNAEKVRETRKAYERAHAPERRAWKDLNPDKVRRHEARRSDNDYHRPFVAIDAEGMDIAGQDISMTHGLVDDNGNPFADNVYREHRAILFGAKGWRRTYSASQLTDNPALPRNAGEPTEAYWLGTPDKRPLSSLEILEWLTSLPKKFGPESGFPDGVNFVSFSFGYDATQILKDLPYPKVREITRGKKFGTKQEIRSPVLFDCYAIKYLKGKYLKIWRLRDRNNPYKRYYDSEGNCEKKLDSAAYIDIQDAFGFYQESFVRATGSLVAHGYITAEEHEIIERNKAKRNDFANLPFDEIKNYCALELDALSKALTVLRDGFDKMDVRLSEWTGAGAAAGAFIRKHRMKEQHYSPDIASNDLTPQQFRAHHAFFGGRIELLKQGYAANHELHVYDIASAYPAGLADLPSMKDGTWEHSEGMLDLTRLHKYGGTDENMLSMFLVRWQFPEIGADGLQIPFYPFPYRVKRKGQILFPKHGKAWLMRDEVLAGLDWIRQFFPWQRLNKFVIITGWSRFTPGNTEKPWAMLPELYLKRLALKLVGDIAEKPIKLTTNSIYGKTAQSVGERGKPPSCACPYYAAAITAHCRSRLLRAALKAPHAIVSFMTDGIVSTRELQGLGRVKPEGAENIVLGDWEHRRVAGGFFLMSGLYALIDENGKAKTKTRGFNPHNFLFRKSTLDFFTQDVLGHWKKPYINDVAGLRQPRFFYQIRKYVTAGEACASENRFRLIGRWCDVQRAIDVNSPGTKRTFGGLPAWAYVRPEGLKISKIGELKPWAIAFDASAKEIRECLRAGEALRCRFLIPTVPAANPTPLALSAPSVPDWIDPNAGLGVNEDDVKGETALLEEGDADTAEILAG